MDEMVEMVRGKLTSGARITICALITINVHGIYFISIRNVNHKTVNDTCL
jgi:hypothetical protein